MKTDVHFRSFTSETSTAMTAEQFSSEFGIPEGTHEDFIRLAVLNESFAYDAETDTFSENAPRVEYAPWVRALLKFNLSSQAAIV